MVVKSNFILSLRVKIWLIAGLIIAVGTKVYAVRESFRWGLADNYVYAVAIDPAAGGAKWFGTDNEVGDSNGSESPPVGGVN